MNDLTRPEVEARIAAVEAKVEGRLATFEAMLQTGFAELRAEMVRLHAITQENLSRVREDMAEFKAEIKGEVAQVRVEVAQVSGEVKSEIAAVKGEVAEVKWDLAEVKVEVANNSTRIEHLESTMRRGIQIEIQKGMADTIKWVAGCMFAFGALMLAAMNLMLDHALSQRVVLPVQAPAMQAPPANPAGPPATLPQAAPKPKA